VANQENLRPPWKKGDPSPNPGGRPRKMPYTDAYRDRADEPIPEEVRIATNYMIVNGVKKSVELLKPGATWAEFVALWLHQKAAAGDAPAAKEIADRCEGKSIQRLEIDDRTVDIAIVFEDPVPPRPGLERLRERVIQTKARPVLEDADDSE
jgi:hypothetical protein